MSEKSSNINPIKVSHLDITLEGRDQTIDLIKIISMFGVLALHVFIGKKDFPLALLLDNNIPIIAMPLFLMVSGYLISKKDNITPLYITKKVIGIIKFVTTIIIIYKLVLCIFGGGNFSLWDFVYPYIQLGDFGVFWYFGTMCIMYMISPLLIRITNLSYMKWIIIFYPLLLMIVFALDFFFDLESNVIQSFRAYTHAYYFVLGAYINKTGVKSIRLSIVICSLVALEFFVYVIRYFHTDCFFRVSYFYNSIPCIVASYLLFVYIVGQKIRKSKIIAFFSNLFLPFYTIHFLLICYVQKWNCWNLFGPLNPVIEYFAVACVCVFMSWVLVNNRLTKWIFKI